MLVDVNAVCGRVREMTGGWTEVHRRVMAAIALEQALGKSVLTRVSGAGGAGSSLRALDDFLARSVECGVLVADRAPPAIAVAGAAVAADEDWYAVAPELEQVVLRELHGRRALREVARETRDILGARSVSDVALALQDGDLTRFARAFALRRLPRRVPSRTAAEWLRVAVCEPFDARWFVATFEDSALTTATEVLGESLIAPARCDALLAWVKDQLHLAHDEDERRLLSSVLRQHALLRGDAGADTVVGLPPETALGLEAAGAFSNGDLGGAQRTLSELVQTLSRGRRGNGPACGAITPMLALLLAARDDAASRAEAKRWTAAGKSDGERAAGRAFRILLKYLGQPEGTHRRIDAYQLESNAGAWEVLLLAYTVHLHLDAPATRASWAVLVARKAVLWNQLGYAWIARQASMLARELSAQYWERTLAELGTKAFHRAGELSLWDLLAPKPEWKKTLEALSAIGEKIGERSDADVAVRVAWYVDMASGSLSRPALQEYRTHAGGWSAGRRVSLAELYEQRQGLPPEDLRVLSCTRETPDGRREFLPEAYEALIDHPRVLDGARAGAQVAVSRGQCRVETEDEAGYIRVIAEPEGAVLGVNVVPAGDGRLVVYRVTEAMQRVIEALPRGVRVPKAQEAELVRVLGKLSQSVEVKSAQLGAEREITADATPCLRIAPYAGAWLVQIGVRPFGAAGRFFVAGIGRVNVTFASEGARLRSERDFALERARAAALIAECPSLSRDAEEQEEAERAGEAHSYTLGEEAVLALLSELRVAETRHELEWPESPPLRLGGIARSGALHARLRVKKGWYLVTGGVRIDEVTEVSLRELVRAPVLASGRFVRLSSGDYLEIEERVRRVMAALATAQHDRAAGGRGELRIHRGAASVLTELVKPENEIDVDDQARSWLERLQQLGAKDFAVPSELRAELRPYQREGFVWLRRLSELGLGACLADDMGLGKTVQIIALLVARAAEGPALVVAPTSVCANWVRELRRFAPSLTALAYAGKDRAVQLTSLEAGTVVVTSYALLQQDEEALTAVTWATAVLDEAQFIKNVKSQRASAALRLNAAQRVAATGTPVENHFGDLFSIFHFLNPGLLGEWSDFNRTYIEPVERGGLADPATALRALVRPYVLRRLKSDVLTELPPRTELVHEVHLSRDEALRYALLRRQVHEKLFSVHGKQQNKIQALAEITRLRRFCCHPKLVFPDASPEGSKVRTFLELVDELRDNERRALVFSQYVDFLSIVREELDEREIAYEYLDGSTAPAARQARVDDFQRGSATLFLISLKAGGFGLNLTGADTVIHLDPWWNPAVEAQATDRSHRIGQERPVTVYRLVTKNTIEEKIVELHEQKQRLARTLLEGSDEPATLSAEELVQLIRGDGASDQSG